jgi:hypothetical protein
LHLRAADGVLEGRDGNGGVGVVFATGVLLYKRWVLLGFESAVDGFASSFLWRL